ncbi:MAG TPA: sigma-54 dependent transcriptional regulator [Acidobacteriota bacterium]|nr:sigma-54 dependent transcriptional regulator [Acidobacteriota bacterium]
MFSIAIVEDDLDLARLMQGVLTHEAYRVELFPNASQFLAAVQKNAEAFDLVLSDYRLPDEDGLSLYLSARSKGLNCPYTLMTAYADIDVAVQAIKAGVSDYMLKPIKPEVLLQKVTLYRQKWQLEEEVFFYHLGKRVVGESPEMQEILRRLSRVANSKASILLMGESGTGKEVLARMLHNISNRSRARFVAVNLSAVPDTLFEAEFFGYRKGAFTSAVRDHEGYARMAVSGTLFLDEIGEMPVTSQAKLLRLLEEKIVQPLGSIETIQVDFRVISATNKDLPALVREGKFREDLYYRLAVISLVIPSLRERPQDIIPLARHLLRELSTEEDKGVLDFTPQAQERLLAYSWPGNVRELKNRIHEALLATDEKWIDVPDLNLTQHEAGVEAEVSLSYEASKGDFERRYAVRLMRAAAGNVNRAAELSQLSRKAVYDLLKRHALTPDSFRK